MGQGHLVFTTILRQKGNKEITHSGVSKSCANEVQKHVTLKASAASG
jgi:hypothetical protein